MHLYRPSKSARYITVTYHSPNRQGDSHRTAALLIKARFLTSIVGDRVERCSDAPYTVSLPPEILYLTKVLWAIVLTYIHCSCSIQHT